MRHGQTDWNRLQLCVGQNDQPLNAYGVKQACASNRIVQTLGVDVIFHSPLSRAARTAQIVAGAIPLLLEPDLREVCLGVKEGQFEADPADDFVSAWLRGQTIPGAEQFDEFRDRAVNAVNRCLDVAQSRSALIVAHSAVFIALASSCGLKAQDLGHCQPHLFAPQAEGWLVRPA
ncbi:MAG: histidine phosphatase family protein [Candidatus Brevundimonas colombiensis]|uniref:Histidine phosphatase family protein n=1 Tax=Candidatus Brevundimonas colombiensis TaxID=3121376 RepID=A0AAJ6BKB3_9CAUL|nr:histidine phosphatase family protein [Brevundimonas sp.]WEK39082.1 MAG: histidine phosphatase family protein [Brevundimonas sp.]